MDWITALRARQIKVLVAEGSLQLSLFDTGGALANAKRYMAAVTSPDFPGERLIVCRNPDLARDRGASEKSCWPPPSATSRR